MPVIKPQDVEEKLSKAGRALACCESNFIAQLKNVEENLQVPLFDSSGIPLQDTTNPLHATECAKVFV